MKLNLGCGLNPVDGYVNVDAAPECAPDQVVDLEVFPWPWPDNSVEVARFHHSLEHMGGDPKVFLKLMQELYRVLAPGGRVELTVPHPRHDNFLGDPTHVRVISPDVLNLFNRRHNEAWREKGTPNTPLSIYTGVDFETTDLQQVIAEPFASQRRTGELSDTQLRLLLHTQNNIAYEWRFELVAHKPPRAG